MIIGKIEDGIVLDHIKAGRGMELYRILGLDNLDCQVALIKNADSGKMGRKDIIKIDRIIDIDLDAIGYVDPGSRSTSSKAESWRSGPISIFRRRSPT